MELSYYRPFISDEWWAKLLRFVELPDEARVSLDAAVASYLISRRFSLAVRAPQSREDIERTRDKLLEAVSALGELEANPDVMLAVNGHIWRHDAWRRIASIRVHAKETAEWLNARAQDIRGKPGRPSGPLDQLVAIAAMTIFSHTGCRISLSKRGPDYLGFMKALYEIADPKGAKKYKGANVTAAIKTWITSFLAESDDEAFWARQSNQEREALKMLFRASDTGLPWEDHGHQVVTKRALFWRETRKGTRGQKISMG
jgi:hypothetical protein